MRGGRGLLAENEARSSKYLPHFQPTRVILSTDLVDCACVPVERALETGQVVRQLSTN